jgi:hypothetical protein
MVSSHLPPSRRQAKCESCAVLDEDQGLEASEEHGVDVGEVDGEDHVGLRGEGLLPGGMKLPLALAALALIDTGPTSTSPGRRHSPMRRCAGLRHGR